MKLTPTLSFVVALLVTSSAIGADKDALQGTWVVESYISMGREIALFKGTPFIVAGDKFTIEPKEGDTVPTGSYKTDNSKDPKQIELTAKGPRGKEMTALAIYKVDGDTLTMCGGEITVISMINADGTVGEPVIDQGPRPPAFDSKHGVLLVLKRKK